MNIFTAWVLVVFINPTGNTLIENQIIVEDISNKSHCMAMGNAIRHNYLLTKGIDYMPLSKTPTKIEIELHSKVGFTTDPHTKLVHFTCNKK